MKLYNRRQKQVNILELREAIRNELIQVLDSASSKALVIDPDLSGPLSVVTDISLLREHGVEKVYYLESAPPDTSLTQHLYLSRPQVQKIKMIAGKHSPISPCLAWHLRRLVAGLLMLTHTKIGHIKSSSSLPDSRSYTLYLVPRRTLLCERVLEDEGVLGDLTLGEFRMDFVPLERDLISLELGGTFRNLYLDGDFASIYYAVRGLMAIQGRYGFFPRIIGKGDYAQMLAESLVRMRRELGANSRDGIAQSPWAISTQFDSIVILDRATDLITPLLTPLTYEGLIDEVFGIKNGCTEMDSVSSVDTTSAAVPTAEAADATEGGVQRSTGHKRRLTLNDTDPVFSRVRGLNFAVVGSVLHKMAKGLQDSYESRHQAKSVQELRRFVGQLGDLQSSHQSLQNHLAMTERILRRTQTSDFDRMLELEQALVSTGDLTKHEIAYLEQIVALGDPAATPPPSNGVSLPSVGASGQPYYQQQPSGAVTAESPNTLHKLLRLLCLYYLTSGPSFRAKTYDAWCNEFLAAFGYHHRITLARLNTVGLFGPVSGSKTIQPISSGGSIRSRQHNSGLADSSSSSSAAAAAATAIAGGVGTTQRIKGILGLVIPSTRPHRPSHTNSFGYLRKTLSLCTDNVREVDPDDIHYVYSGYAPLSVRLLQCLVRDPAVVGSSSQSRRRGGSSSIPRNDGTKSASVTGDGAEPAAAEDSDVGGVSGGWKGWEDILTEIPGATVDIVQRSRDPTSSAVATAGSLFLSDSGKYL
ncbi:Vacuolar protein-sorting-associated protein 33 [Spiromyces aspiralis]|uniref:Vacuolar protein-sorting-associated protein 33 n=1 Tax=Spiromyces aspiralis TaxID=68401 RepID=A0ACC1HWQ9_9FUNG|nr:Vacuolar protein-sorting-associated protein 33 [Spiromyces aspiralis]